MKRLAVGDVVEWFGYSGGKKKLFVAKVEEVSYHGTPQAYLRAKSGESYVVSHKILKRR